MNNLLTLQRGGAAGITAKEINSMKIVIDGNIEDENVPVVPAGSRGLMYGEGCFETFRTYSGRTFLLDDHMVRLRSGLRFLGISLPEELEPHSLRSLLKTLLQANGLMKNDAIVRMQVWREGTRGYKSGSGGEAHFSITASECPERFAPPVLVTAETRRIPSDALPSSWKFTNGINYILAAREAAEKGGDDALMLTVGGLVSETTVANIFWLKGQTVFTPSENCDLLPGTTRSTVIDLTRRTDLSLEEGEYRPEHLKNAGAVWICNSVREVLPVGRIDDTEYDAGHPFLQELGKRYESHRNRYLEELKA